jgi:hypothetical protein
MKRIPRLTKAQSTLFWRRVDKSNPCWEWTGASNSDDYGTLNLEGSKYLAHRVSYALAKGDPGDLNVNHTCDNPPCVNPLHLWLGTQQEGVIDKVNKSRQQRGRSHGMVKLTEKQVREITKSDDPQCDLSQRYKVSESTISRIKHKKRWKHFQETS